MCLCPDRLGQFGNQIGLGGKSIAQIGSPPVSIETRPSNEVKLAFSIRIKLGRPVLTDIQYRLHAERTGASEGLGQQVDFIVGRGGT